MIGRTFSRKKRSVRNWCLRDLLLEIPIRRRDHPDVDADVRESANALEALLLEEAQQLGLEPGRHLADLVEEHRAAVRRLEQALLLDPGIGEGAALVAEELALEQLLRAAPSR